MAEKENDKTEAKKQQKKKSGRTQGDPVVQISE